MLRGPRDGGLHGGRHGGSCENRICSGGVDDLSDTELLVVVFSLARVRRTRGRERPGLTRQSASRQNSVGPSQKFASSVEAIHIVIAPSVRIIVVYLSKKFPNPFKGA